MKKILTSAIAVGSAMTLAMISAAQVFALDENALQDGIFNEQAIAEQQFVNSFSDETTREVAEYYLNGGLSLEETADMVKIYEEGVEQMSISTQSGDVTTYYSTSKLCGTKHYVAVIEALPQYDVNEVFDITLNTRFLKCDPAVDKFTCFPYTESSFAYSDYAFVFKSTASSTTIRTNVTANAKTNGTEAENKVAEPLVRFRLHYGDSTPTSENALYKSISFSQVNQGGAEIETFALGDVNHDGVVDAQDQSYLTKFLIGSVNDFDFKYSDGSNHFSYATNGLAADVNQDNVVDMLDAIQIGKYVSGQSSTLVD